MKITEDLPESKDRKVLPMVFVRVFRLANIMDYLNRRSWHHVLKQNGAIYSHRCTKPYSDDCMKLQQ